MITAKRTVGQFLKDKYGTMPDNEKRALFEREVPSLFKEYRQWYQDNNYGKSPSGVKEHLFKKWLVENGCFFISKKK